MATEATTAQRVFKWKEEKLDRLAGDKYGAIEESRGLEGLGGA
jgi:hypothetical protein